MESPFLNVFQRHCAFLAPRNVKLFFVVLLAFEEVILVLNKMEFLLVLGKIDVDRIGVGLSFAYLFMHVRPKSG